MMTLTMMINMRMMTNDDIEYDDKYEDDDRSICPDSDHLGRKASHMWTVCFIIKVITNFIITFVIVIITCGPSV